MLLMLRSPEEIHGFLVRIALCGSFLFYDILTKKQQIPSGDHNIKLWGI